MRPLLSLALLAVVPFVPLGAQDAAPPRTVIDADTLEMQGTDDRNYFYFRGNVHVSGDQLEIKCHELVITATRGGETDATVGEIGAIERIVASGEVHITQAGRQALAQRAEVDPSGGTVTLSGSPRIIDDKVEVEGYQFVFHTEDRRIETVADPDATPERPSRSRVSLSSLPPIGFSQPEEQIRGFDRLPAPPAAEWEFMDSPLGEEDDTETTEAEEPSTEDAASSGGERP